MIDDLVDALFGGRAADFRLRAGAEAFGDMRAHLDEPVGLRHGQRLGVGVGDDELDALQPCRDHVVDGVAAAAADAEDGDPRLQLGDVRLLQIDSHCPRPLPFLPMPPRLPDRVSPPILETVSYPLPHARELSVGSGHPETDSRPLWRALDARDLRIDHQADRRREGRALGRFRQARDAERTADATLRPRMRRAVSAGRSAGWRRRSARRACRPRWRSRTWPAGRASVPASPRRGRG